MLSHDERHVTQTRTPGGRPEASSSGRDIPLLPSHLVIISPPAADQEFLSEACPRIGREEPGDSSLETDRQGTLSSPSALSIEELLENGVPLDWQEAVAIAQRICETA